MFIKEDDNQEKEYGLGPIAFGTLYKNWSKKRTGYKARLLKLAEENPNLKVEIQKSIDTTEKLLEKYLEALNNWKTAARIAKKYYDEEGGTTAKVKNFFGFDSGKQDDKMFGQLYGTTGNMVFPPNPPLPEQRIYSIKDILSMDFNIGLAHPEKRKEGKELKEEVQQMVAFIKYFKKRKKTQLLVMMKKLYKKKLKN